ncbi:hypothetical protein DB41_GZ00140 [Neochlamydia sp. TUME1]|nr:hypothetical protein DB41_GZ00140 [Neochlamydia sp. TUME1]
MAKIAYFAEIRASWFADLIGLKVAAPSYDTLWWFLARVHPQAFKELINRWLQGLPQEMKDQLLGMDGKRLKGVFR